MMPHTKLLNADILPKDTSIGKQKKKQIPAQKTEIAKINFYTL